MFEDDGETRGSVDTGEYELLDFEAAHSADALRLSFTRSGGNYPGRPDRRELNVVVHNWQGSVRDVRFDDRQVPMHESLPDLGNAAVLDDATLTIRLYWDHQPSSLTITGNAGGK